MLLLCQNCLALTDNASIDHDVPLSDISNSCHEADKDNQPEINDDEHCIGACDCDAFVTISYSEKNAELKENTKFFPDIVTIITLKIALSNRAPPLYPHSSSPERATLSPYYSYNVLLI